jgi:hypothetical protein
VPDIEIAAGILRIGVVGVLWQQSKAVQGAVVQAVCVGVTRDERQSTGEPLVQGYLEAVIVGPRKIRRVVDKAQVWELGRIGRNAGADIRLIDVPETEQPVAMIADICEIQHEVIGQLVLDAQVPVDDVGIAEIRIHAHDGAWRCVQAFAIAALRDW